MESWSVGGISDSEGWPQRTQKAQRFGTPTDAGAKNIKPQQLIDMKYLDEMEKSGFDESLWGRERK